MLSVEVGKCLTGIGLMAPIEVSAFSFLSFSSKLGPRANVSLFFSYNRVCMERR